MTGNGDNSLIHELQSGDTTAFKSLVDLHQDLVLNICYRFLRNRQDAEDTAQEVFIEAYCSISRFRGDAKLSTWLYRIAASKSLDFIRRKNRKKRFSSIKSALGISAQAEDIPSPDGTNPDTVAERKERLEILQHALNTLPENQSIAITLSKYEGFSQQEIAGVLGTTVSAVESLIHRAKQNLKKKLTRYYEKNIK
jgi:RNA polymerase sigma-70 factor, ECF subfamily